MHYLFQHLWIRLYLWLGIWEDDGEREPEAYGSSSSPRSVPNPTILTTTHRDLASWLQSCKYTQVGFRFCWNRCQCSLLARPVLGLIVNLTSILQRGDLHSRCQQPLDSSFILRISEQRNTCSPLSFKYSILITLRGGNDLSSLLEAACNICRHPQQYICCHWCTVAILWPSRGTFIIMWPLHWTSVSSYPQFASVNRSLRIMYDPQLPRGPPNYRIYCPKYCMICIAILFICVSTTTTTTTTSNLRMGMNHSAHQVCQPEGMQHIEFVDQGWVYCNKVFCKNNYYLWWDVRQSLSTLQSFMRITSSSGRLTWSSWALCSPA